VQWTCNCGEVQLQVTPGNGARIMCYCSACRDFAERFGAGDTLDPAGGADLFQTAPEMIQITKGRDYLSWIKLTPKGPHRWHTTCCNTPMANTLGTRAIPFATILSHNIDDKEALGPIIARVNRKSATGHFDGEAGNTGRVIRSFLWRTLRSRASGRYKQNPFFTAQGKLIADGKPVHD